MVRRRTRSRALRLRPRRVLCALLLLRAAPAWADSALSTEFWPEINAYVGLGERSRLLFTAAATRAMEGQWAPGQSTTQDAQFSVNFDYTLAPVLRRDVPAAEWSKNRLLWGRLGFEYGTSGPSGDDAFRAYTGIVELNARLALQGAAWLTSRLRADLREINGEASQRYRVRLGAEWDASLRGHPLTPYASVEALYDTRYDRWSRLVLKTGLETPIGGDWRVEPYLALQLNRPSDKLERVLGIGLTFKVYLQAR